MAFGVNVYGANRLIRTLKKADMDVSQLKAVNKAAASTVAGIARLRAPVGTKGPKSSKRYRPGKLSKSVRAGATQKAGVIRAGSSRVPYALPIHWGWKGTDSRGRRLNIKPNYFISDAAIAGEPIWIKQYEQHMSKIVRSVKGVK